MTTSTATESKVNVQLVVKALPCLHYFYSQFYSDSTCSFLKTRVDSENKEVECSKKDEIKIDCKIKMCHYLYMNEVSLMSFLNQQMFKLAEERVYRVP